MRNLFRLGTLAILLSVCTQAYSLDISSKRLEENIKILSSDEYEGRAPSTRGETLAVNFLQSKFKEIGFEPGNRGSYFQEISLFNSTVRASDISLSHKDKTILFLEAKDIHLTTKQISDSVTLNNSELVFVGYGAVAPEFGWNDYANLDVSGKTVLILNKDPGHLSKDKSLFNGKAMTYYGRTSYKLEEAKRQGAAAALIIHDSDTSTTSWEKMTARFKRPIIGLDPEVTELQRLDVEGWIPRPSVETIFANAGLEFEVEKQNALKRGFHGYSLKSKLSANLTSLVKKSKSNNVIAILPGTERPDEYIFYVAHWDHLGKDESLEGDQIYNGARDNASGTAAVLEIAQAFKSAGAPKRSIVILAVTAEERGLLGSYYYVNHPIFPLNKTVTVINIDTMNLFGRTKDAIVRGLGDSEMDQFILPVLEGIQKKLVIGDPRPEAGIAYRGDHFSFNRVGVPALVIKSGTKYLDKDEQWIKENASDYSKNRYHKTSDEYLDIYNLSGVVDILEAMYLIGRDVANSEKFPNWYAGKEFKYLRDAHMKEIGR